MSIPSLTGYHFYASSANVVASGGVATALNIPDRPALKPEGSPAVDGNELVFDGSNDRYVVNNASTLTSTLTPIQFIQVPDASGGVTGEGFTCTGLAPGPNGTWFVGNDGRQVENDASPFLSAVVHLSADFSTVIKEVTTASLGLTPAHSVQGVAYLPSLGQVAFAFLGTNQVYFVDADDFSYVGVMPGGAITGLNGLAYDSVQDAMITLTTAGVATWRNRTTGAVLSSATLTTNADQIHYDAGRNWIWYTTGANGSSGQVRARQMENLTSDIVTLSITGAKAIEGVVITEDRIWLTNDQYYHPSAPAENSIIEVALPNVDGLGAYIWPHGASNVQYFGVMRIPTAASGSVPVAMIGDALSANSGHTGIFTPTATSIQLLANRIGASFTVPNLSTEVLFYGHIDLATDTAQLWINGVSQGTTAMTGSGTTTPNITMPGDVILGHQVTSGANRWFRGRIKAVGATLGNLADREIAEGFVAWETGREDLLPEAHPYKLAAPVIEVPVDPVEPATGQVFTANLFVRARAYLTLQGRPEDWDEAVQEELEAQGYSGDVDDMLAQKATSEGFTSVRDMAKETHIKPKRN